MSDKILVVQRYECTDGKAYKTRSEATQHQKDIDFEKWYDENRLYGDRDGAYVICEDLVHWLNENKTQVLNILEGK